MATSPPSFVGNGIVTVPDTGGAPTITAEIINAMWDASTKKTLLGTDWIKDAMALAQPAPQMAPVDLDTSYLPPPAPPFPTLEPGDGERLYDEKVQELLQMIQDAFTGFIETYFPNTEAYEAALQWCERAITKGGTGFTTDVEQGLWQRDRARIMADSERTAKEAEQTWANRRFPLPPGALTSQINQINLDTGRKLAESSRTVMIKSWDTEIENVRFAVKSVLDLQVAAMNAAGDYVKTIMMGPQTAMQLATGLSGLQTAYYNSLVAYYSAQNEAAKPRVQLAIADANLQAEIGKANLAAQSASVDAMVKAAMAAAQMMAAQASAGLNAINAQSSISGQDVTSN